MAFPMQQHGEAALKRRSAPSRRGFREGVQGEPAFGFKSGFPLQIPKEAL